MTKLGLMTIHGMGKTKCTYADDFFQDLENRLGKDWQDIHTETVYYQKILQDNQGRYYEDVRHMLEWSKLRQFVLFGFSDAASLESQKGGKGTPYYQAQEIILERFRAMYSVLKDGQPLIVVAQSLGGQVLSNYLWDASKETKPDFGIWATPPKFKSKAEEAFCRGGRLRTLFTTGCNIPIFVAGISESEIKPIIRPRPDFEWCNFYDADDVLGWPLQQLNAAYDNMVKDRRINTGFTPNSHNQYWSNKSFLKSLVQKILALLEPLPMS